MSKKSGPSVSSSKSVLNTNSPLYSNPSAVRWQTTYMPSVGHQLTLPPTTAPPGLWTPIGAPITAGYGYGYPFSQPPPPPMGRFAPPPPAVGSHSNYCCMANQRHQCPGFEHSLNGWPPSVANCWNNNNHNLTTNGVAITEVRDESKDDSDGGLSSDGDAKDKTNDSNSKKKIKKLKQLNEELKSNLEETKQQLKQTEETLLKLREQLPFECLEYYRKNLKNHGDFIRQECNRFYQNEDMAHKLKPIVEQLSEASHHVKEEKEKNRQSILTLRQKLKDNNRPDLSDNMFSPYLLPEFPDLLSFYKSILDDIPHMFLNDLNQLKRPPTIDIQTKQLSNNGLPISSPFGDEHIPSQKPLNTSSSSNILFSAPNISDLPKPDFNTLPLKQAEPTVATALDLSFPIDSSPTPLARISAEPLHSTPHMERMASDKNRDKQMSPICKPLQPMIDLKAICAQTVKNSPQSSSSSQDSNDKHQSAIKSMLETDFIRAPTNPIPKFAKLKPTPVVENDIMDNSLVSGPTPGPNAEGKLALNQAQSKLLVKLKEKYPQMTDVHLIESMAQTKAVLIGSGNTKGFSGMKVVDIVNRISDFIDTKVLTNNFTKPRFTNMKSSTNNNNVNSMVNKMANTSMAPISKKAWNTMTDKSGKYDDSICCSICFESLSMTTKYETECKHFFHYSCISNWIRTDGSCPICRRLVLPPGEFPEL